VPASPLAAVAASPTKGIHENVAGLLCYLFGWVTGIIFLQVDKRPFVKFHAAQSIAVFGGLTIIRIMLVLMRRVIFGFDLDLLVLLASSVLWVLLMIKAFQHEMFRVPIAADIADSLTK